MFGLRRIPGFLSVLFVGIFAYAMEMRFAVEK